MDTRSRIPSIERRLDQVELEVHILQENQVALERTVARLEGRTDAASLLEVAPAAIVCPHCYRNNAPSAAQCIWCHRSLLSVPQAAVPAAPLVPSVPVAPEVEGALDLLQEATPLLPCPHCHN